MKKSNNLAVILLNYNDADTVINYAKVIEKYSYIDKIIVVDNASLDDSYKRLKKLQSQKIDVVKTDGNKGYSYGNNYGIKYLNETYGEFKYLAVSNSDVEVSEDTFKKCVSFLEKHNDVALCGPRMYDLNKHISYYCAWKHRTIFSDIIRLFFSYSYSLNNLFKKHNIGNYPEDYLDKDDHVCYKK